MAIIDHLLENPSDKDFDFIPLLHASMLSKVDDIRLAIDGLITPEQLQKMNIILNHYTSLETCKKNLESLILSLVGTFAEELVLVSTVPHSKVLFLQCRYLSIKRRRGHKRAIIAIARMILTAIYHILKNREAYNAELYKKAEIIPDNREVSVDQAIFILQRQGYSISKVDNLA
jgi:hypothetical protein